MILFVGLIILNGLKSRMRLEYEFKTQEEYPLTGNDFCVRALEENKSRPFKEFKLCYSLVSFRVSRPSKKVSTNCKVQEFLNHIHDVSHESWTPGKIFLIM